MPHAGADRFAATILLLPSDNESGRGFFINQSTRLQKMQLVELNFVLPA